VTKFIAMIVMNLVTLKAAVKLELSFNKQAPAISKLGKISCQILSTGGSMGPG
jgi:hypothetical protein